jgi:hypothetical protein
MNASITRVAIVFIEHRLKTYLRFGHPIREQIIDGQRRVAEFGAQALFCRIRWEANDYGTTLWQLSVLQAAAQGEALRVIAGVTPGVIILLHVEGAPRVQHVLHLIDEIEAQSIDPADVAPSYWQTVHNRLAARVDVGPYTRDRHDAHLLRRSFE